MSDPIDVSQLSASELDELIAEAAVRRASLAPACPVEPPKQFDATINPEWFTSIVDAGTLLQLRHPGLGWLSFVISPNERARLLRLLLNQALFKAPAPPANVPPPVSGGVTVH